MKNTLSIPWDFQYGKLYNKMKRYLFSEKTKTKKERKKETNKQKRKFHGFITSVTVAVT